MAQMKAKILELLADGEAVDPQKLFADLMQTAGATDGQIRNAIWRLVEEGKVRWTWERKLELVSKEAVGS
jgi:hypothetical protein